MYQRNNYNSRAVRSPFQPHPAQVMREKALDTQDAEHPMRKALRKFCAETINLSVTFSEDAGALSTLKVPGLIAIKCVVSKDGKAIGIGHGSSILTRLNRSQDRIIAYCVNGALMSAMNSACKVLDAMRANTEERHPAGSTGSSDAYPARESNSFEMATPRQLEYLKQLVEINCTESEQEKWAQQLEQLTKDDASQAIESFRR